MRKWYLFRDRDNGIEAACPSKSMAWMLIRNECHRKKLPIPTMDKIDEIRELPEHQIKKLQGK